MRSVISTPWLKRSHAVHRVPINQVLFLGPLEPEGSWKPHLEGGFPLRCFQRLSRPDIATQRCSWCHNWYTSGPFTPVLSY